MGLDKMAKNSKNGNGSSKKGGSSNYRSSITGRYVKEEYAKKHPKTTVKEKK